MRKLLIAGIVIVSTAATAYLIYLALSAGRGQTAAAAVVIPEPQVLRVAYRPQTLALEQEALFDDLWEKLVPGAVPLAQQVTAIPWGKASVPEVRVAAFHNGKQIYFRFQWEDSTQNREVAQNVFADACAVMFPLAENPRPESIMMGFLDPANIWAWKASRDAQVWGKPASPEPAYSDYYNPFVKQEVYSVALEKVPSAVQDLVANRVGTTTPKPEQRVRGRGAWSGNRWTVVVERALETGGNELDARIQPGASRMAAFAVWDGAKGDRGARKSVSDWVRLEVAP
jgi:hypothetical protein